MGELHKSFALSQGMSKFAPLVGGAKIQMKPKAVAACLLLIAIQVSALDRGLYSLLLE